MADARTQAAWREARRQILLALNLAAEYEALGLRLAGGGKPNAKGWLSAHSFQADDKSPSAGINVADGPLLGFYHDFRDASKNCGFFDFCIRARGGTYADVLKHFATKTGVNLPNGHEARTIDRLEFRAAHYSQSHLGFGERQQYANGKRGVTVAAMESVGCLGAAWPRGLTAERQNQVIVVPMYGSSLLHEHEPTGWHLAAVHPHRKIRKFAGKGNEEQLVKTLTLGEPGLMGLDGLTRLVDAAVVNLVEGLTCLLATQAALIRARDLDPQYERHVVISTGGATYFLKPEWLQYFAGKEVRVWGDVGDKDGAGDKGAARQCTILLPVAGSVRNVKLPLGKDGGKNDVRAWLTEPETNRGYAQMDEYARSSPALTEPTGDLKKLTSFAELRADEGGDGSLRIPADKSDPAIEAENFLNDTELDGTFCLRFWRDSFWQWKQGRYSELSNSELNARLVLHMNARYSGVTTSLISNLTQQVKAQSILSFDREQPCWLGDVEGCDGWAAQDMLATRSHLIHLPSLAGGRRFVQPTTPLYFTPVALNFEYDPGATPPTNWLDFLHQIWNDDPDSIGTLQEWFGYCLTPDTRQQKILLVLGPRRSGKGTIARVLRSIVGEDNVAGPALASLATQFGLQPLLGKTLGIIADARLSGKTDQSIVVERLLSISGEDTLTADCKHRQAVTGKLLSRIMILTNELPRLHDSSGAIAGRLIILRQTESFFGRENTALTKTLQAELPGILLWAIEGWRRLWQRGHFVQPSSARDLEEQLNNITSPVGEFVREWCILGPDCRVEKDSLYAAWRRFCEERGQKPTKESTFGADLRAAASNITRSQPRRDDGSRYDLYRGITLNVCQSGNF